ncbi:MAG: chorismate synthase [Lentisphaeria bacterium]|jgi:chorismate synthase|nr:chorismate synthase [Lentisphaeria bacterium]
MSSNTFGTLFRVTTFGESHGAALGCVVDGVPAGLPVDLDFLKSELVRRRPGQSGMTTPRQEADEPEILSGVLNGVATGAPLAILFRNTNQHSADYDAIANLFRPGHADYAWERKFGFRDARGGGRTSGRETVARVAAGAIAKMLLAKYGVKVRACTLEVAGIRAQTVDWDQVERNPVRAPDAEAAARMAEAVNAARADHDSVGGVILCEALGLPAGLGEPVFDKLDALTAHAILSIGGVKGIEFGAGFGAAAMRGSVHNDPILPGGKFASNNAGGVLGGISNGDVFTFRCAVKPTASIARPQQTVDRGDAPAEISTPGRHDPCLAPRMVPVVEAMTAIVLADLLLLSQTSRLG